MGKTDRAIHIGIVVSLIAMILAANVVFAWPKKDEPVDDSADEVDPLAVAALMIADKHFDRAEAVLESVDLKSVPADFDRARYYLLYGLVLLELGKYEGADAALGKSVAAGQSDKTVYLFAAQAEFHLEKYKEAVANLEKAGEEATKLPGGVLLRAECHWRAKEQRKAFEVIGLGLKQYPDNDEMKKARVLLLVDLGLYQAAMEEGLKYLSEKQASPDEYTALAEALIEGKQSERAAVLLETARLTFPENADILIQLAKAYLESGHTLVGARLFEHASNISPKLTADAAELYRRAGRTVDAIRMNAKIADQPTKIRQRLGLLIETERFEEAAALAPRLKRLHLTDEDAVVYGLAYAYFMIGQFKESERYLKQISDGQLFEKAIQLRRIMGTCTASGRQCP